MKTIETEELKEKLDNDEVTLIEVLEEEEYNKSHIKAQLISPSKKSVSKHERNSIKTIIWWYTALTKIVLPVLPQQKNSKIRGLKMYGITKVAKRPGKRPGCPWSKLIIQHLTEINSTRNGRKR